MNVVMVSAHSLTDLAIVKLLIVVCKLRVENVPRLCLSGAEKDDPTTPPAT